jgi:hypothetical protein
MLEILLEIRDAIDRNKLRTIATGVAVASGLFLLIVLLAPATASYTRWNRTRKDSRSTW